MGGAKKKPLSAVEKQQKLREEKEKGLRGRARKTQQQKAEKKTISTSADLSAVMREIGKFKVLTPYTLASHYGIKLSQSKVLLRELEKRGIVKFVTGNSRIKIYCPVATSPLPQASL